MRLLIRNLTVTNEDETLLDDVAYTFYQGNVYCINAPDDSRDALFNSIVYGKTSGSGKIELICNGRNCMAPAMISRFPEEPLFPEFLTIRNSLNII